VGRFSSKRVATVVEIEGVSEPKDCSMETFLVKPMRTRDAEMMRR
jgi:hypothetical protein